MLDQLADSPPKSPEPTIVTIARPDIATFMRTGSNAIAGHLLNRVENPAWALGTPHFDHERFHCLVVHDFGLSAASATLSQPGQLQQPAQHTPQRWPRALEKFVVAIGT